MFPTSSTRDGKRQCCEIRFMNYQAEAIFFRGQLLFEHIGGTTVELAVFDINRSEVMVTRQWAKRGQIGSPEPTEASENEVRCSHPDTKAEECHVQERHTADTTYDYGSKIFFFPRHFWRVPQLFLTSLMGIAYACGISSTFGRIQPSKILTSPREEKLKSHHNDESNVVRV